MEIPVGEVAAKSAGQRAAVRVRSQIGWLYRDGRAWSCSSPVLAALAMPGAERGPPAFSLELVGCGEHNIPAKRPRSLEHGRASPQRSARVGSTQPTWARRGGWGRPRRARPPARTGRECSRSCRALGHRGGQRRGARQSRQRGRGDSPSTQTVDAKTRDPRSQSTQSSPKTGDSTSCHSKLSRTTPAAPTPGADAETCRRVVPGSSCNRGVSASPGTTDARPRRICRGRAAAKRSVGH